MEDLNREDDTLEIDSEIASSESSYIKELQRNIRNATKKLSAIQKVQSVIADNPSLTLDEMVSAKKINSDQKAQLSKRPLLQQSLQHLEEHLVQYRKLEAQFQRKVALERQHLVSLHQEQMEQLKISLDTAASRTAQIEIRRQLLILSKFLRAAAARRMLDSENQVPTEDSQAFEGALLLLYGGDCSAVDAAEKLISGSSDVVTSTEGEELNVTYGRVRDLSLDVDLPTANESLLENTSHRTSNEVIDINKASHGETDPEHSNIDSTELQDQHTSNKIIQELENTQPAVQATIDRGLTGNVTLYSRNDSGIQHSEPMTDSWVSVSHDPIEMAGNLSPAATNSPNNWADELAEPVDQKESGTMVNDGFHEVHHGRENRMRDVRHADRGSSRVRGTLKQRDTFSNKGRSNIRGDGFPPRGNSARGRVC